MASKTRMAWTPQSWSPVTGCTKRSAGCKHCYAEAMALRLHAMRVPAYAQGFALTLHEARLQEPLRKKPPTVFFVCLMGDLFHEQVPDAFIENVLAIATKTPRHTYQLLTKRAGRMAQFFKSRPVPANVWLGVTVEDRRDGLPRIDRLRQIPTRIRFLSIEPLLEDLGQFDLSGIHWVLVGGESGPEARPMRRTGRGRCAINVRQRAWLSSSNNGEPGGRMGCVAPNTRMDDHWTGGFGMSARRSKGCCCDGCEG